MTALTTIASAEKLRVTIKRALPLVNTDANGAATDYPDLHVHVSVTPEGGTSQTAQTPVVADVPLQQAVLEGYAFPVFTVPARALQINWEIRDKDGQSHAVMDHGSVAIPLDGGSHAFGSVGFADAYGEFEAAWVPDWAKVFGVICDGENGCLDLEGMAQRIDQSLSGNPGVIKFGYRINIGLASLENAEGVKRSAADGQKSNFAVTDRFNPASVTKTVTAVALLRVLEKKGIDIHSSIATYLPTYWAKHSSIGSITFQQVLSHTSGFRGSFRTFDDLRDKVAAGGNSADKLYDYANMNYNLCRVLLVYASGYRETGFQALDGRDISSLFRDYIDSQILMPIGIPAAKWEPDLQSGALFYPYGSRVPIDALRGTGFANRTGSEGSGGIQLSIREISTFLSRMWIPGLYLSRDMLNKMRELEMGGRMLTDPLDGPAFVKGGFYPQCTYGAEESSCIVQFGNGLSVVCMINGRVNAFDTVIAAYNQSWYEPAKAAATYAMAMQAVESRIGTARRTPAASLQNTMLAIPAAPRLSACSRKKSPRSIWRTIVPEPSVSCDGVLPPTCILRTRFCAPRISRFGPMRHVLLEAPPGHSTKLRCHWTAPLRFSPSPALRRSTRRACWPLSAVPLWSSQCQHQRPGSALDCSLPDCPSSAGPCRSPPPVRSALRSTSSLPFLLSETTTTDRARDDSPCRRAGQQNTK